MVFKEEGGFTDEALIMMTKINKALAPLMVDADSLEITPEQFCYLATSELDTLVLTYNRHKRMQNKG